MKKYNDKGMLGVCIELTNNNYGSMLQSYATQVMLSEYGFQYEMLSYKKKYTIGFIIKSIPRLLNAVVWQEKKNVNEKRQFIKNHPEVNASVIARNTAFKTFRDKYFSAPIVTSYGFDELRRNSKKYNVFLVGSDQLWSPSGLPTNFYNLMFTEDSATRISYASSFGVKEIPWYQKRRTKRFLDRFSFLSCREQSGADIVRSLTGRAVPVVADPTMLFDANQWDIILETKRIIEGKYIFSYLLGTNKAYRDEVKKLSETTGLPIISIHQYVEADMNFGDKAIEDAGPAEFISLIKHAEFVCTDSFHGSVFAILYHTRFVVFNRYSESNRASKNTRIENLCKRLGFENRRFSGDIVSDMYGDIDFEASDSKLKSIREESRKYLEEAFDSF